MVVVSDGMIVIDEMVFYVVLSGLISYVAHIRSRAFYVGAILAMPVMVLISIADTLAFTLLFGAFLALLRFRHWRRNANCRTWEMFAFGLVFLLDILISSVWSEVALAIFHPALNVAASPHLVGYWLFQLMGYLVQIIITIKVAKWLAQVAFTKRELSIVLPQMYYALAMMVFLIEYLRLVKAQGTYELLVIAFVLTQGGYAATRTISSLRKDKQQAEIASFKQQLASMSIYTKQLEQSYDQMRQFRHDFKNLLLAVDRNAPRDSQQAQYLAALHTYSDQALAKNVLRFGDLTHLQVPTLKTLIVTKLTLAQQQGITLHFECLNPIAQLYSDDITVIRIVGVLLDNAIEASAEADDKRLKLLVIGTEADQELIVENTYAGKLPAVAQMRKLGFSTKGTDRGYGLANVETLLDQHAELSLTNYVAAGMYGASLLLTRGR